MKFALFAVACLSAATFAVRGEEWTGHAPREEIEPEFSGEEGRLILSASGGPGTNGHWRTTFPVEGGEIYRFEVKRRAEGIAYPRRSCVAQITWLGEEGQSVLSPEPINPAYFGNLETTAQPEFPRDGEIEDGWVKVAGTYRAPMAAVEAQVRLHLRWTAEGRVEWKDVRLETVNEEPRRPVVLAAVHHNLAGSREEPAENLRLLAPFVEEAARRKADLVVLPELLTCKGVTREFADVAEPVPGPTTDFLGTLAGKLGCHIVAGLVERDGNEIFNTAVLLGPGKENGALIGKYRKVSLPREEIERGLSPGESYPVFDTPFGKLGLLLSYDVFFPEVARELAAGGAEVIALPIWGGHPRLAAARCIENGVYLVTSTYADHGVNWMKTAVWNREGDRIAEATGWGTVVTAEVDLARRTYWHGLGDFRARIFRESPIRQAEPSALAEDDGDAREGAEE